MTSIANLIDPQKLGLSTVGHVPISQHHHSDIPHHLEVIYDMQLCENDACPSGPDVEWCHAVARAFTALSRLYTRVAVVDGLTRTACEYVGQRRVSVYVTAARRWMARKLPVAQLDSLLAYAGYNLLVAKSCPYTVVAPFTDWQYVPMLQFGDHLSRSVRADTLARDEYIPMFAAPYSRLWSQLGLASGDRVGTARGYVEGCIKYTKSVLSVPDMRAIITTDHLTVPSLGMYMSGGYYYDIDPHAKRTENVVIVIDDRCQLCDRATARCTVCEVTDLLFCDRHSEHIYDATCIECPFLGINK